jgi:hypothetical protein
LSPGATVGTSEPATPTVTLETVTARGVGAGVSDGLVGVWELPPHANMTVAVVATK